ncbi:MAG: long-chain fatty acid--CoA ligase [Clostridiales bacterium]|nr:long-chain fatty acid--CoA ligase [Clostridiales bacterium]
MSRVALIGENSLEYIEKLIHIWNSGDCAVLLDWRIPLQTAIEMMREADVYKCFIEDGLLEKSNISFPDHIEFVEFEKNIVTTMLPQEIYDKFQHNYETNEAVVIYSSGTTGKSKGIILSHYAINTNADAIIDYMQPNDNDCIYIAKTLSHSSTLTGELLVALKTRTKLVIAPTIVPPRFVLGNIEKYKVSIICLNPMLLSMYAQEYQRRQYDIRSLKTIYVSGSVLSDKTYSIAHDVFCGINIYNVYGLSEAGPRVSAQTIDCCKSNSVGKAIRGVDIVIVDENGNQVPWGERGIVHIKVPSKYSGYISGGEKHTSLFNEYLNTGDVGYFDTNEELHIVGRIDDVIIIDAHKIYPYDVEKAITKNTCVTECVILKCETEDNTFLECIYVSDFELPLEDKRRLSNLLMPYEIPKHYSRTDELPKNNNGKLLRNKKLNS